MVVAVAVAAVVFFEIGLGAGFRMVIDSRGLVESTGLPDFGVQGRGGERVEGVEGGPRGEGPSGRLIGILV